MKRKLQTTLLCCFALCLSSVRLCAQQWSLESAVAVGDRFFTAPYPWKNEGWGSYEPYIALESRLAVGGRFSHKNFEIGATLLLGYRNLEFHSVRSSYSRWWASSSNPSSWSSRESLYELRRETAIGIGGDIGFHFWEGRKLQWGHRLTWGLNQVLGTHYVESQYEYSSGYNYYSWDTSYSHSSFEKNNDPVPYDWYVRYGVNPVLGYETVLRFVRRKFYIEAGLGTRRNFGDLYKWKGYADKRSRYILLRAGLFLKSGE